MILKVLKYIHIGLAILVILAAVVEHTLNIGVLFSAILHLILILINYLVLKWFIKNYLIPSLDNLFK